MSRARLLLGLVAIAALGATMAIVKITDRTAGKPGTGGPAIHAVVLGAPGPVDIWRDARGRLTFHHALDHRGDVDRWNPRTHTMDSFIGGALEDSESGLQSSEAWAEINAWYGVSAAEVGSALASGDPSPEPVGFTVSSPSMQSSPCDYAPSKNYGTDIRKAAAATGFVLPRLTKLAGLPLTGLSAAPNCSAAMTFGSSSRTIPPIEVDIAPLRPGDPNAPGTYYRSFFERLRHHHGAVEYVISAPSIVFPYASNEWISVDTSSSFMPGQAAALVRAIVSAPSD